MFTHVALAYVLVGATLTGSDEIAGKPICCLKEAHCCEVQRDCCPPSTNVCCAKRAYCCAINARCCGKSLAVDELSIAAVGSDQLAKPTCCMKRAYCCLVVRSCCPGGSGSHSST